MKELSIFTEFENIREFAKIIFKNIACVYETITRGNCYKPQSFSVCSFFFIDIPKKWKKIDFIYTTFKLKKKIDWRFIKQFFSLEREFYCSWANKQFNPIFLSFYLKKKVKNRLNGLIWSFMYQISAYIYSILKCLLIYSLNIKQVKCTTSFVKDTLLILNAL